MIHSFFDLKDKIKRYFKFSKDELKGIVVIILTIAFVISFKEWGPGDQFELFYGLKNLFIAVLMAAIIVFVHHAAQRIAGLSCGHRAEHKIWWAGIIISIVLVLLSKGNIWFLAVSGVFFHHLPVHRLGHWRYGLSMKGVAGSTLAGPAAIILIVTILKTIELWFPFVPLNPVMVHKFFLLGWGFALWNLLPIPPLDGSRIMFTSRLVYAFIFGFVAGYFILVYALEVYSFLWALVIAIAVWLIFYIVFERKW